MTFLIIVGALFLLIGSFAEGPSDNARRLRRLDPGGRNDFGGRL